MQSIGRRTFCSADNAYAPSIALFQTFTASLDSSDILFHARFTQSTDRRAARHVVQHKRLLYTTSANKHAATSGRDAVLAVLEEDRQKLAASASNRQDGLAEESSGSPEKSNLTHRWLSMNQTPLGRRPLGPSKKVAPEWKAKNEVAADSWQKHMRTLAEYVQSVARIKVKLSETDLIEKRRTHLDYDGKYITPEKSVLDHPLPVPWVQEKSHRPTEDGSAFLENEINAFVSYAQPTPAERQARDSVIVGLLDLIHKHIDNDLIQVELFGSEKTGLALATSDIDLRLQYIDARESDEPRHKLNESIRKLGQKLFESSDYICVVHRFAKYPIINAQHKTTGVDIQIVSAPTTKPQEEVTVRLIHETPHLRSLYILLRAALGTRGLIDVFNGGIGSYGLFMMLAASMRRPSSDPPTTAVAHLLRFLDFYSELDMTKYGISTSPAKLFKKHDAGEIPNKKYIDAALLRGDEVRAAQWSIGQTKLFQPYLLCLQDPVKPSNDLGRKSNAIKHITATFRGMHAHLLRYIKSADEAAEREELWAGESMLLRIVGRIHEVDHERRKKLEEYGLEIMASRNQAAENERAEEPLRANEASAAAA